MLVFPGAMELYTDLHCRGRAPLLLKNVLVESHVDYRFPRMSDSCNGILNIFNARYLLFNIHIVRICWDRSILDSSGPPLYRRMCDII
jgi:hypothetical protein